MPPLLGDLLAGRAKLKETTPTPLHEDDDVLPPPPEQYGEPGIRFAMVPEDNEKDPATSNEKWEADALAEAQRLRAMRERIKRWTSTKRR